MSERRSTAIATTSLTNSYRIVSRIDLDSIWKISKTSCLVYTLIEFSYQKISIIHPNLLFNSRRKSSLIPSHLDIKSLKSSFISDNHDLSVLSMSSLNETNDF